MGAFLIMTVYGVMAFGEFRPPGPSEQGGVVISGLLGIGVGRARYSALICRSPSP